MKTIISLLFILIFMFSACSSSESNTNAKPSPSPTPTKEENEQREKAIETERENAVNAFITKAYKGWQLKGIAGGIEYCDEDSSEPCNLLLNNGKEDKVVSVMIKRFTNKNGQSYLYVFEARAIDLSKARIEKVKDQEREDTIATLTVDDLDASLKQEIVDASDEERAQAESESADPPDRY